MRSTTSRLQHEVHVADDADVFGEMEEQRRRDVVGQVADQAQIAADAGEVESQGITFVDGHACRRVLLVQAGDQVAVDFDDVQMIEARQQRLGNCPEAGADFDDRVAALRIDGGDDGIDDAAVNQEILPESFAGDVALHWRTAMRVASATASNRLPGSARPLPASSSAVP